MSRRCVEHDKPCPHKIYWNIDYKLGAAYLAEDVFSLDTGTSLHKFVDALKMLLNPSIDHWPYNSIQQDSAIQGSGQVTVTPESIKNVLWQRHGSGCILKLKVWSTNGAVSDLAAVMLVVTFDGAVSPQVRDNSVIRCDEVYIQSRIIALH